MGVDVPTSAGEIRDVQGKLIAWPTAGGDPLHVDLAIGSVPPGLERGWAIDLDSGVGQRVVSGDQYRTLRSNAQGTASLTTTIPVKLDQGEIYSAAVYLTPAEHGGAVAYGTPYPPGQATP